MARYSGTAHDGDFNEALRLAIQAAKEGLGSTLVRWTLLVTFGSNGGTTNENDLTVEIEASVP